MKKGNWIPLDKNLIKTISKTTPYSYIEAMFSLTYDIDNGKEGSINGYSKLWNWSRNKVRRFVNDLRTGEGHLADSRATYKGHAIRLINNDLKSLKDTKRTGKGQAKDREGYATIYPKPKPDPKPKTNHKGKFVLPELINKKAWEEFEQHRKEIKKPLTDLGRAKAVKKLEGHNREIQQKMIDNSIDNKWTGIFPLKGTGKNLSPKDKRAEVERRLNQSGRKDKTSE